MSSTGGQAAAIPRAASRQAPAARDTRPILWAFSLTWISLLAWGVAREATLIRADALKLIPWVPLILALNLFPLYGWKRTQLVVDDHILMAAAVLLRPIEVSLISFLGRQDVRQARGEITHTKALFNRSEGSAACFFAGTVVHVVARSEIGPSLGLPLALLALATETAANFLFVVSAIAFEHRRSVWEVIRRLHVGSPLDFALSMATWGVLAGMLAIVYMEIGAWALVAFAAPAFLTRQVLMRSKALIDTSQAYRSREQALAKISAQIRQERLDERRLIAADLHDEVLQPLFKVSLMGQVLRGDLASGRLLELDQDLPELMTAAELAAGTLRELIGDLRNSALGRGGLSPALSRFLRSAAERSPVHAHADIAHIEAPADVELAIYQIGKEALTNALTHSRATNLWVKLEEAPGGIVLTVRDDGVGFDPDEPREQHFGLHIMRERAAAIGGHLRLEAAPGRGCVIGVFVSKEEVASATNR